jgi:hypothetical protein
MASRRPMRSIADDHELIPSVLHTVGTRWMDSGWPFIKLIPLEMKSHECSDAPT